MDTIEIKQYLGRIHPSLSNNVYAANRLPLYVKTPSYLISNLDPDSKPGSHWIAIHIDRSGFGQYFDSYGRPPSTYHKEFLRRNARHCAFNRYRLQYDLSSVCGQYSLTYLHYKFYGHTLNDFLRLFGNNRLLNDIIVLKVFKWCFDKNKT